MEYQDLIEQNTWWEESGRIDDDEKIRIFEAGKLKRYPRIFDEFDFSTPRVYTIRGPRQVGKTTLQKLLIRKLLKKGTPPQGILYYSLDFMSSYKEIADVFKTFSNYAKRFKIKKTAVFLDEISAVQDWSKAIKYLVDTGLGKNTTFILTGSSAGDIRRGTERMPGRRGGGKPLDKVLLPLSFREYLGTRMNLPEVLGKTKSIPGFFAIREEVLDSYKIVYSKIQSCFEEYSEVGGFPRAVEDLMQEGKVTQDTLDILHSVIVGDIEKLKKSRIILRQVMKRLYELMGSRWSFQGLTRGTEIGSYHTSMEYIETLTDSYILSLIYFFDPSKKKVLSGKNKKAYLIDPLVYKIFATVFDRSRSIDYAKLAEDIVFSNLIRSSENDLSEGLSSFENTFYWHSKKGHEVDFLVYKREKVYPFEVKYKSKISPSDYITLMKGFGKGMVLTRRDFFKRERIVGIPVSIFLSLLETDF